MVGITNLVPEEGKRRPWKRGCEIPRRILHGFLPFDMCKLNSALGHFEKLRAACKSIKLVQFCHMTVIAALSKYSHGYFLEQHNPKIQQIQDIWAAGLGVVSLHIFQSVIPVEAYTREACMIDALGLSRLTNKKRGDYYGRAASWNQKKRREMGVYLLKRALKILLNEGERQLRPNDLRAHSS